MTQEENKNYEHFGEYVYNKRQENEMTLREFCRACNIDPSNWSKVERGIATAPKDMDLLFKVASNLNIINNEVEMLRFWLLYSSFPIYRKTESVYDKLPILISGKSEKQLLRLFEILKNA